MDDIVFILVSLFIAWIWVDYFRLIDVFEKDNLLRVAAIFFLGSLSVVLVLGFHELVEDPFGLVMNGEFVNDYLYCIFDTGLIEESSKVTMFVVVYFIFRKHINEPIDVLATMSVCALGFAAAENVLYFSKYGAQIISARAILSTVGHMMFTSIVAYGIILVKFRKVKFRVLVLLACLLVSSIFHGSYNFWLMYEEVGGFGRFITVLVFFVGISVFATILNNTLNISQFFTYKHVINSSHVAKRLLLYYFSLFILQCGLFFWRTDLLSTLRLVFQNAYMVLPVVMISIVRLSRFKLIRGKWNKVTLELPFYVSFGGDARGISLFFFRISIKGDPYSDHMVNVFFESHFHLKPISKNSKFLKHFRNAYIYDKIYLNNDQAYYAAKIFLDEGSEKHELVLLQIKHRGKTMMNNAPIVAILEVANVADLKSGDNNVKTEFLEWATVVPIAEVHGNRAS